MGDPPGLIMVFDDVGDHADVRHLFLRGKNTGLVIIRCNVLVIPPTLIAPAKADRAKVIHGVEIAFIADEIPDRIRFLFKHLSDRKSMMRRKAPLL